jgi:hypothetical protein
LVVVNTGGEAVLLGSGKLGNDGLYPRRRFTFTINNFRKAAALAAMQIDVGETEVGDGRDQAGGGGVKRQSTSQDQFE